MTLGSRAPPLGRVYRDEVGNVPLSAVIIVIVKLCRLLPRSCVFTVAHEREERHGKALRTRVGVIRAKVLAANA